MLFSAQLQFSSFKIQRYYNKSVLYNSCTILNIFKTFELHGLLEVYENL